MYVRNCWYMAGWSKDFTGTDVQSVSILNEPLVMYRADNGSLVALEDRCPHRAAPLSKGRREGNDLRCMYHGIMFGPDGACTDLPGQPVIPKSVCVRSYNVIEKDGCAWVWMGEADRLDFALIPNFIGPDHPDWAITQSQLDIDAEGQLLIDNLLDVSHAPYVHEATFGVSDKKTVQTLIEGEFHAKTTKLERGVHIERWHVGRKKNPFIGDMASDDLVINEVNVPGVFTLMTRSYAPGVQDRCGSEGIPEEEPILSRFIGQIVTPVKDGQCKLFYAVGPWSKHAQLKDRVFKVAGEAFREDEDIIVAQQRIIDRNPNRPMLTLGMDGPLVRYLNIVKRLIAQEQERPPVAA
ncbi:putative iron-sulfur protein [Sphingobium sp. SYK-6]|uniref:aromatic ring-hydroxylating dioxygenase subunit alpha n=1 Tax=Sphingobium sp. (strain NBRC 103272 / SYK-6) TaxID=627192 RepID=UPI00022773D2|nr:aromatic ring-hydroxylating dioxygenase subunit alpha [Sphingobium sp. SYK-6]BAK66548.1 putative iron-sulfur protein [Sphingobium sp. SYK-6]